MTAPKIRMCRAARAPSPTHVPLRFPLAGALLELLAGLASLHTQLQQLLHGAQPGAAPVAHGSSADAGWSSRLGNGSCVGAVSSSVGSLQHSSGWSGSSGGGSSMQRMFIPLIETVAEAVLPALSALALPQLSALGQEAWAMLAATGQWESPCSSSSSSSGDGGSSRGGLSSNVAQMNSSQAAHPPSTLQARDGGETEGWGAGRLAVGGAGAQGEGLAHLAAVYAGVQVQLETKVEELYLLPAETVRA